MIDASALNVYAVALGSNRRHGRHGSPKRVISAALDRLSADSISVLAESGAMTTAAMGPSLRSYANAVALIACALSPPELLQLLKVVERDFGRRPGQRWGARVLDLDIILWSGGMWSTADLSIPHPYWRERSFVIDPLVRILPEQRDPQSRLTVRHLAHRLHKPQPVDPAPLTA